MQAFTQVLYRLLDNPEYIEPLRREVEAIVAEDGWTKAAMDKMYKIDSFIRETQRIDVGGICLSAPSVAPQLLMLARKVGVTQRVRSCRSRSVRFTETEKHTRTLKNSTASASRSFVNRRAIPR